MTCPFQNLVVFSKYDSSGSVVGSRQLGHKFRESRVLETTVRTREGCGRPGVEVREG